MSDSLVLVQFPISHFCLKVRMVLDRKGLRYKKKTVYPFLQWEVKRLSGQSKVPVLMVNGRSIADSTDIALYLEERYPEPAILPADPALCREVMLWEDWSDESLSFIGRDLFYGRLLAYPELIGRFLPKNARSLPPVAQKAAARTVVGAFSSKFRITPYQMDRALVRLGPAFSLISGAVGKNGYLVGGHLTLADIAVAASLDPFRQVRLPGDGESWDPLFRWADQVRAECRASRAS